VEQEQQSEDRTETVGDRLLQKLGIDPKKWTIGDRRLALLGVGIGLTIVIIAVCSYVFGWEWTGLAKRTFWDWLSLLIVPVVLALGGYLFNRSESRRTQDVAERQRAGDREIADQRGQDDALQAYLDHIGELLLDKDKPLRQSEEGDEVRTLARARTLTVLRRLDSERKGRIVQFLYESGLIAKDHVVLDLKGADLSGAALRVANLERSNLSGADLSGADLLGADLRGADLSGANLVRVELKFARLSRADLLGAEQAWANLFAADLRGARLGGNLNKANLSNAILTGVDLRYRFLIEADLSGAIGIKDEELAQQAASLEGATMPNGQKYEDWLKSQGRGEDGENSGP
jgi:uncharacterized protein YjbI with pentapeptide repeats